MNNVVSAVNEFFRCNSGSAALLCLALFFVLQLFRSIEQSCLELLRVIEKYQDRLCGRLKHYFAIQCTLVKYFKLLLTSQRKIL